MPLSEWNPVRFFEALRAIDRDTERLPIPDYRKAATVLLTVALCLFFIHYLKFNTVYQSTLAWLSQQLTGSRSLLIALSNSPFAELQGHAWWTLIHVIGYVIVPCLVIKLVLREPFRDYGYGWGDTSRYLKYSASLAALIVGFAFLASFRSDFAGHYPFYSLAGRSYLDLLLWETLYIAQFVALEFFFRGFFLHSLRPQFGAASIFIMCVPYFMIHFSKPWLEAFGAIPFGILLGVLALRSRSMWGGAGVHATIAVSMDLLALWQTDRLPDQLLP